MRQIAVLMKKSAARGARSPRQALGASHICQARESPSPRWWENEDETGAAGKCKAGVLVE
jgi:hypothetical protein